MNALRERFEAKFQRTDGCWNWLGALGGGKGGGRYGHIRHEGKPVNAHRVSYMLYRGAIPDGMHVLHRCDNPACVNPEHLFLGTHLDNMRDMYSKGRRQAATGLRNGAAKLDSEGIQRILGSNLPSLKLAPLVGVSASRIRQIRRAEARQQGAMNHG